MAAVLGQALGSSTGLGHFVNRSLQKLRTVPAEPPRRSDLWPCPPPSGGCWTDAHSLSPRRRKRQRFFRVRALCLQQLVIVLNWLALGQCRSPPDHGRLGYPLSAGQHELLERLEDLVDYYLLCGELTQDSLGRASEKLRNLSACVFSLPSASDVLDFGDISSFLESIRVAFDGYSSQKRSTGQHSGSASTCVDEPAENSGGGSVQEQVRVSPNACSAKPVVASRIKWKLAPSFDPRPYLTDPVVKKAYEDPDFLRKPEHTWPRLGRAKVHAARSEVLALAGKWDALGACRLVSTESVRDDEAVGLFAVAKDEEYDR